MPHHKKWECFVVVVLTDDRVWAKACHFHAPLIAYRFWSYEDAVHWARNNVDEVFYEITTEILTFDPSRNNWF